MTTAPIKPNPMLFVNLARIMSEIKRMPKGERNPQGWTYTSVMDILDELRPAMAKHGIIMYPDVESCEWLPGESRNGTLTTTCHMTVRWTVTDGTSTIAFRTVGEALDTSDKSANKALTAAQKLAVSKLVMLSTGDDPDAEDIPQPAVRPATSQTRLAPPRNAPHGECRDHGRPWFKNEDGSFSHTDTVNGERVRCVREEWEAVGARSA